VSVEGVTLEWLLARVQERPGVFAPLVEKYGRARTWAVEDPVPGCAPDLVGPGGFAIHLRRQATLELWHGIRFDAFTGDAWHRGALRRVCLEMAGLVGSQRAIYTHELMPYGSHDGLARIEAGLRELIGPPADTFEELDAAEYYGPRAWSVDDFADLRGA
jgi:hypothetical protein